MYTKQTDLCERELGLLAWLPEASTGPLTQCCTPPDRIRRVAQCSRALAAAGTPGSLDRGRGKLTKEEEGITRRCTFQSLDFHLDSQDRLEGTYAQVVDCSRQSLDRQLDHLLVRLAHDGHWPKPRLSLSLSFTTPC